MCETGDQNSIDPLKDEILKIYPNTYTFSKNLAEQVISNNTDSLPVVIVRPIGALLKAPSSG